MNVNLFIHVYDCVYTHICNHDYVFACVTVCTNPKCTDCICECIYTCIYMNRWAFINLNTLVNVYNYEFVYVYRCVYVYL